MIRALCAFVVFILFMAIRPAQAGDDWEFNFRRCDVAIPIYGEGSENEDVDIHQGEDMYIVNLGAGTIPQLKKASAKLEECRKFWTCVRDRDDKGKKLRCIIRNDKVIVRPR
jgi:hypothetical protein